MKVFVDSVGCRLNHGEMETLARELLAAGHDIVGSAEQADKVVLNTCAVTAEAARVSRQRARRFHRSNAGAEIIMTGCYATIAPAEIGTIEGVTAVIDNRAKDNLARLIDPDGRFDRPVYDLEPMLREFHAGTVGHTRAFVKVQDGCDNRCTFCVTTIARGPGRSRPLGDVIAEIQGLAAAGYREAVLSGVHLGAYGRDLGQEAGLWALVAGILAHSDLPRLRLSSLEPWDITPGFFDLWADPRLLPHLHLPLQSGSDRVLRRMARRTRRDSFRSLVAEARAAIDDLNLTTDIIVGFPGETEADFEKTLDFVEEIDFSRVHAFPYSRRPGTAAASLSGQIPKSLKKARMARLQAMAERLGAAAHGQFTGRTVNVLWESITGANGTGFLWSGYSDHYLRVTAAGPKGLLNQITPCYITGATAAGLSGEISLT